MARITDHYHSNWDYDKRAYADGCSAKEGSQVDTPPTWVLLSSADNSEPYSIDITEIYKDGDTYILLGASGCSCWDGAWSAETYDSLELLEEDLRKNDPLEWMPTGMGADVLLKEARESLAKEDELSN